MQRYIQRGYIRYVMGESGALPSGFPGTAPLSDLSGDVTSLDFGAYVLELFPACTTMITLAPYSAKNGEADKVL